MPFNRIVNLDVPVANRLDNLTIKDVIGQKGDREGGDSIYSRVHTTEEHVHSYQWVYPTLANSVQLGADAAAWTPGIITTIMPANTRDTYFDIHGIVVCAASAIDEYELILYAEITQIGRVPFTISATIDRSNNLPFQCEIIVNPGVRIRGRLACLTGGKQANVKILGHDHTQP